MADKELSEYGALTVIDSTVELVALKNGINANAPASVLGSFVNQQIDDSGLPEDVENLKAGQSTSAIYATDWNAGGSLPLSTLTPSFAGQGAFVPTSDTGTHTDGVTGTTVANAGSYTAVSVSGVLKWKWLQANTLAALAATLDAMSDDVLELDSTLLRTEVPGYLAAIVDSLNRITDLSVRSSDGQIPDFVMSRWGKRLGIIHKDVPGYLLTFTDSEDRMTDLSIRESDGQFADFVIKRLALRLVNYLDFDKDTIVPASYGTSRLRGIRMKLGKIAAGDASSQLNIAFIGDSWTAGSNYWLLALANRMYSEIGFGGYGFVGPIDGAANTVDLGIVTTGSWVTGARGTAAPDDRGIVSGAADDEWLLHCNVWTAGRPLSRAVTSARLLYKGTGTISYKWQDADAYTDISVDSATPAYIDLANLPTPATTGSYAWVLHVKMSVAGMTYYGVVLNNGVNGVVLNKMGASGSTSGQWYSSTDATWNTEWIQAAMPIPADAYFVMFGMNDQTAQFSVATYLANMQGIVANVRSINPGADIHLCVQPRTTVAGTAIFASYFAALKAWAYSDGKIAVTNLQEVFGPDYKEYAVDGDYPLIDSTNAHPAPLTGGRVITESFFRIISKASE